MTQQSFTWLARREGNDGYVLEKRPDGSEMEFGPMPARSVPFFIDARRQWVGHKMREAGATHTETTTVPDKEAFT